MADSLNQNNQVPNSNIAAEGEYDTSGQPSSANEQGFLMFVAENSGIKPADLELLFYNGFDNPESFQLA